jgi:uncharacterized protein (DUF58 family)
MIPSTRLLYAVLASALLGVVAGLLPAAGLSLFWWGFCVALAIAAGIDAWLSRRPPALRVERQVAGVWPVNIWGAATLTLHNEDGRALRLELYDDYPTAWEMEGLPCLSVIAPGTHVAISLRLRPNRRGNAHFGPAHLRIASPLGLWQRMHRIGPTQKVKVFPNFSQLFGYTLTATDRRAPAAGAIRKRRRGEGTDFRQLREYRQGDSLRSIDWKATARQQKPISREYQEERDQQVVFLLDTGRRMLAHDAGGSHFDHALNAVITLGFVAQKQGDAVGLMSFGSETRWLNPQKGRIGLDRLLAGIYDLQAEEVTPDYTQAADVLLSRLRKRAFIVLITNLRDEDDQAMRAACELLSTRHLVLCASLREKALDAALGAPVVQFADALRFCASAHYLQQREDAIKHLGIRASHLIDITPELLSMTLVNRYLGIKESGQL